MKIVENCCVNVNFLVSMDAKIHRTHYVQVLEHDMLFFFQISIGMGLRVSSRSGSISFTFRICDIILIFERIISTEESDKRSYGITQLGLLQT